MKKSLILLMLIFLTSLFCQEALPLASTSTPTVTAPPTTTPPPTTTAPTIDAAEFERVRRENEELQNYKKEIEDSKLSVEEKFKKELAQKEQDLENRTKAFQKQVNETNAKSTLLNEKLSTEWLGFLNINENTKETDIKKNIESIKNLLAAEVSKKSTNIKAGSNATSYNNKEESEDVKRGRLLAESQNNAAKTGFWQTK